jgi:hypothetical protein
VIYNYEQYIQQVDVGKSQSKNITLSILFLRQCGFNGDIMVDKGSNEMIQLGLRTKL